MLEGELLRAVREEIRRQINIVLFSSAGTTTSKSEVIEGAYPGAPGTSPRPIVHPYGFASRAPRGTISLHARIGDHVGNKTVLGHLASDRPDLEEGEAVLYNASGGVIKLGKESTQIENNDVNLLEQLIALCDAILNAKTNTMLGPQPLVPPTGFSNVKSELEKMKGGS